MKGLGELFIHYVRGVESVYMCEEADSVFLYVYYVKEWIVYSCICRGMDIVYTYISGGLDSVCMHV